MNYAPTKELMSFNPEIHHRRSIRLNDYDYSHAGAYFVTVCAWKKEYSFGEMRDGEMILNKCGEIVSKCWDTIQDHFHHVQLDEFVIMPNHVHGIIVINTCRGEVSSPISLVSPIPNITDNTTTTTAGGGTPPLRKPTLGQVVAYFKYRSAKQINIIRTTLGGPLRKFMGKG